MTTTNDELTMDVQSILNDLTDLSHFAAVLCDRSASGLPITGAMWSKLNDLSERGRRSSETYKEKHG